MSMAIVFWPSRVTLSLILVAGSSGPAGLYLMLGLVLVSAPFWYLAIRSGRRERQRWVRRGQAFDEGSGTMRRGHIAGHFRGREVALFYTGGGRRRPRCFNAQLACSSPLSFEIDPHATIVIGKARNSFETGDADLDRDFAFVSDAPERFEAWFQKPENNQKLVVVSQFACCSGAL